MQGVSVSVLGSDTFPAFFSRDSGCAAPHRVETPETFAGLVRASDRLGIEGGLLLAVPIPAEHEAEAGKIEEAIAQALREAETARIRGKDATPFLLKRVAELTGGASLRANVALVKHNAKIGARVAVAVAGKAAGTKIGTSREARE